MTKIPHAGFQPSFQFLFFGNWTDLTAAPNETRTNPSGPGGGGMGSETDSRDKMESPHPKRYLQLLIYSLVTFNQGMLWLLYSPVEIEAQKYYGITADTVTLILNWGPIVYLPLVPLTMSYANKKDGLKRVVRLAAFLTFGCSALRLVPSLIGGNTPLALVCIHAGSILNAAAGPLVMSTPSQFSRAWFHVDERTTATAIASLSNQLGCAVAFILGPLIANKANPEGIPHLLWVSQIFSAVTLLLVMAFFEEAPQIAIGADSDEEASSSLVCLAADEAADTSKPEGCSIWDKLCACVRTGCTFHFVVIFLAGGMFGGVFQGWCGLFDIILEPVGFNPVETGWLGFTTTLAQVFGGVVAGRVADMFFRRRLKRLLLYCVTFSCIGMLYFTLSLPCDLWGWRESIHKGPHTFLLLIVAVSVGGLFAGASYIA